MIIVNHSDIPNPIFEFISLKDPHMNFGFANRIRYNHQHDLITKLNFVREWGNRNNVKTIIATGDVVDTNEEAKWSFKQYVLNKNELLKFKQDGFQIWSPAGNHDMFNGMAQTTETVFGEFVREEVINYLTTSPIYKTFRAPDNLDKDVVIYGVDYSKHKEIVQAKLKEINDYKRGTQLKIVVFHSHCTPSEVAVTDFTYENLVKEYNDIDVFICGHYHGGFPTSAFFQKDDAGKDTAQHVMIVNNWSFQRVVRDYYNEMDVHVPEFEHIKIGWSIVTNNFIVSRETIKIPCKPYVETFKPKAVELLKLTKKEQFEFFEKINFEEIPTGDDDFETLQNISSKENISPEVVNLAIAYLNNVKLPDIEN